MSSNEPLPIVVEEDTSCGLGTDNPNLNNTFILYPNPANDYLLLDFMAGTNFTSYQIIDASGKVLEYRDHIEGQNRIKIDTTPLAAGFYLLQLQGFSTRVVKQFIKR